VLAPCELQYSSAALVMQEGSGKTSAPDREQKGVGSSPGKAVDCQHLNHVCERRRHGRSTWWCRGGPAQSRHTAWSGAAVAAWVRSPGSAADTLPPLSATAAHQRLSGLYAIQGWPPGMNNQEPGPKDEG
jgi:hypothetical protein